MGTGQSVLAKPTPFHNILRFDRLDVMHDLRTVLALGWRFTDDPSDPWTSRMNSFKAHDAGAVRGSCLVLPMALAEVSFRKVPIALTSAIPSRNTSLPASHPLAILGASLASTIGGAWMPLLLSKKRHRRLHGIREGTERDAEVRDTYRAGQLSESHLVLVLDDLVTRGATLCEAARSILASNPGSRVVGVVLGKTERLGYAQSEGVELNNNHIPEEWATMWDGA